MHLKHVMTVATLVETGVTLIALLKQIQHVQEVGLCNVMSVEITKEKVQRLVMSESKEMDRDVILTA